MTPPAPGPETKRAHYSYAHYADTAVAQGFDELRFGGPIGRFLMEEQSRLLSEALAPVARRTIVDVGTGTGRAAIGLAGQGAHVLGLDASQEMLDVARQRAEAAGVSLRLGVADAHHLPVKSRGVDAAVSLRVLMHAVDWRQCVAELCRVSRWRVVIDFPALGSCAALESGARKVAHAFGRPVEAYRVISERSVHQAFRASGFRVIAVRRQFVLPIAVHKTLGRLPLTLSIERGLATVGALRLLGSPVTMVAER